MKIDTEEKNKLVSPDAIVIKGAREHNLKNIDINIPRNKIVVFTGVSGSGKSSLAFDTIYAEGRRRYVESLSSYARQFLGVMDKPDIDSIDGLSPAISIDQKSVSHNPRSTVGTITEIYDYLRLLFARIGHPHCPQCGREIIRQSSQQIVDSILNMGKNAPPKGLRILILAPVVKDRKGEFTYLFNDLRKQGYTKVRIDEKVMDLDNDFVLIKTNKHNIEVIVDRLIINKNNEESLRKRLFESVEIALRLGAGLVIASEIMDASFEMPEYPENLRYHLFSEKFACPDCQISLPEIEPRSFSFNSPHGACPNCTGLGNLLKVDPELVFSPNLTIAEGGILPWSRLSTHESWFSRLLEAVAKEKGFLINVPISNLTSEVKQLLLYGSGDQVYQIKGENRFKRLIFYDTNFEGVIPNLMRRYKETESDYIRKEIERFMTVSICRECEGTRLKKESLSITIKGENIAQVSSRSIKEFDSWVNKLLNNPQELSLNSKEKTIAQPILKEISSRTEFLLNVGLSYLTLDRQASTLAGGESQRIRLASQIGTKLSGVLYVLDEPSIGLHQRDNSQLITTLKKLRDLGNTVIVVEHDREMMEEADYIIDFGPGAGEHGGNVIVAGAPEVIKNEDKSITGKYLSGKKQIQPKKLLQWGSINSRIENSEREEKNLSVIGASEHNLKNINVEFPLGKFIAVTGVSGSGKSTLVHDIVYKALAQYFFRSKEKPGKYEKIIGFENIDKVIMIDQSPIGRTPRSNPATYTGVFTPVREIFAKTKAARVRGYTPGRFSFNVKGGRCEACEGEGQIKIEMQFMPDIYVNCEVCQGSRYNHEALEITLKGLSIAEVLNLTVEKALDYFDNFPSIKQKLDILSDVGLGYVRLGQPATTLSGGEAQRIKLASELSKRSTGRTVYILDEPTTGLHFADIERLLSVLRRLTDLGNTVIIIEHNLDVIKNTDWIIDLGPEGGNLGGNIIFEGTPKDLARDKRSYTGQHLALMLGF